MFTFGFPEFLTIEITPSDHKPQRDTAFVYAFHVVRGPRYRVGNTWIDAHGTQEHPSVLNVWISRPEQHGEAGDSEQRHDHIAVTYNRELRVSHIPMRCQAGNLFGSLSGFGLPYLSF